jgi:protein tyrosine/serine phosphatase
MRRAYFLSQLAAAVLTSSFMVAIQPVWAQRVTNVDLPNFHAVAPGINRSGQPSLDALAMLARKGYKTVVDLRMEADQVSQEAEFAKQLGMKFVAIPMDELHGPSQTVVQTFIATLKDPQNQPVLVHCADGQDRTGAMIAFYRMQEQKWPAPKAYKEMVKYGFHPMFLALSDSVFDYQEQKDLIAGRPDTHARKPNQRDVERFDSKNSARLGSRLDLIPM